MLLDKSKIDKTVPIPLYFQLKELILAAIKDGSYPSGSLIPTENELSQIFEISRTTVRQAITELVSEGWLYRVKSKGTFVSRPKITQDFVTKIESYNTQMARKNITAATEVIEFKKIKADENIAQHLDVKEKDPIVYLHRRRFANEEPIITIRTYLPYDKCSHLLEKDFTKVSLYAELGEDDNTKIVCIKRCIEAVAADSKDVQYFNITKGKPILYFSSVGFNVYNQPIEYSLARYRGDRSTFEVTAVPE